MNEAHENSAVARLFTTPAGIDLGPLDSVADGDSRGVILTLAGARFQGFIVRKGQQVYGYVDRCPHTGLPLSEQLDAFLTPERDLISCAWHGALFSISSGLCLGGPCAGRALSKWPLEVKDGQIITGRLA